MFDASAAVVAAVIAEVVAEDGGRGGNKEELRRWGGEEVANPE